MQRIINRSLGLCCGLLLVGVGLSGCAGAKAQELSFTDASGASHMLSDYQGQVVVLSFSNTWSDPCRAAAPHLQALHERFAAQGVKVMAVNAWERGDPLSFMDEHGYTFEMLLNGTDLAREYKVTQVPTFYILGVNGRIIFHHEGFEEKTAVKMTKAIDKHLMKHGRQNKAHGTFAQHPEAE